MRYTPVELRHVRISRGFFGYRRDETNRMLEDVADSFEEVWSERGELTDKLEDTEKQLADFKEREVLLANTLISAEKAAADRRIETLLRSALGIVEESSPVEAAAGEGEAAEQDEQWPKREDTREFQLPASEDGAETQPEPAPEPEPTPEPEPVAATPEPEPAAAVSAGETPAEESDKPLPPPLPPAAEEAEVDGPWAGRDFAWG
jgi:hypothetical protein